MRRKHGTGLVKNEVLVLEVAAHLDASGQPRFYGYDLVGILVGRATASMSQPTVYRTLRRLEESGHVQSEWESLEESAADGRDGRPRRYYRLTSLGCDAVCAQRRRAGELS